jgi:hypothetical protein
MVAAPTLTTVKYYLADAGTQSSWSDDSIQAALDAEADDQTSRCRIPTDPDTGALNYPPALVEALCRRVAHNLAVRALPLGVQATITDAAALNTYVGGTDAEVRRLEAPWRKLVVG